jgi:hypothetical protein
VRRERLARRLLAREGAHLGGLRRRLLGRDLVLGGIRFELLELELHLVEQPRLALAARPIVLASHLLDGEPQMRNQSLVARRLRTRAGKLGIAGEHKTF